MLMYVVKMYIFLGRKPYEGMIDDEMKAFVRSGSILPIPDGCPAKM